MPPLAQLSLLPPIPARGIREVDRAVLQPDPRGAIRLDRVRAIMDRGVVAPAGSLAAGPRRRLAVGVPALDDWLKGWPHPGIVEIVGAPGSGRLAPVLPALAALTRQGRPVIVVDPEQVVNPVGFGEVDPARIVLVRAPRERAAWAAEQAARSGAVEAVVLLDLPTLGRAGLRLARAAEAGGVTVFVVSTSGEEELPAALRLRISGWEGSGRLRMTCVRSREGAKEGERRIDLYGAVRALPRRIGPAVGIRKGPREEPPVEALPTPAREERPGSFPVAGVREA